METQPSASQCDVHCTSCGPFVLTKGQITIDSDLWLVEAKEKYIKRSFLCYLIKTQWQKDNISMLMCPKRPHFTRPWHNLCGRFLNAMRTYYRGH